MPESLAHWGSSEKNVQQNWKLGQGRTKMKTRPYSGPKTELNVFLSTASVYPFRK